MKKPQVHFIEAVPDVSLESKERLLNRRVRRLFPQCGPIKLYRTSDGRIGFQVHLSVALGERQSLDELYRFISRSLGARRGRLRGVKTVQTKLNLRKDAYTVLKKAASSSQ